MFYCSYYITKATMKMKLLQEIGDMIKRSPSDDFNLKVERSNLSGTG
jgi:hypothetical protein